MDIDSLIAAPLIWTPKMEDEELQYEIEQMLYRSQVAALFLEGKASLEDYLDCLNDQQIDVSSCVNDWVDGISYI